MSTRPELTPFSVITSGNMTLTLTSTVVIIQKISMIAFAFSWSGSSPLGTIAIQASNDYSITPGGAVKNAGTWNALTVQLSGSSVSSIPVSGNTGNGLVDIDLCAAYAIRAVYTPDISTPGTGTLQCVVNGKVT